MTWSQPHEFGHTPIIDLNYRGTEQGGASRSTLRDIDSLQDGLSIACLCSAFSSLLCMKSEHLSLLVDLSEIVLDCVDLDGWS